MKILYKTLMLLLLLSCTDKFFNRSVTYPTFIVQSNYVYSVNYEYNVYVSENKQYYFYLSDSVVCIGKASFVVEDRWRLKTGNNDFTFLLANRIYIDFLPSQDRMVFYEEVKKNNKRVMQTIYQDLKWYIE